MILLYDYHNRQHILLYLVVLHENILLYTTTAMLYLWCRNYIKAVQCKARYEGLRSEWFNQTRGFNQLQKISAKKKKNIHRNDRYLTQLQYHEMPATINVGYLTRYMPQNVSYCQCQVLRCQVHILWQLYMKLSGIEMSQT